MRELTHTYELCQGWGELRHMCGFVLDGVNNVVNRALKYGNGIFLPVTASKKEIFALSFFCLFES